MLQSLLSFSALLITLWFFWRTNRKMAVFEDLAWTAKEFLRYEEDQEGNPLIDARLQKILGAFGSSVATSLKMSVLGTLSGQARLEKGLKGAMATDFVEKKAPILKALGDLFGLNTAEYIGEHPDAVMQVLPMLKGFLGRRQANPGYIHGVEKFG